MIYCDYGKINNCDIAIVQPLTREIYLILPEEIQFLIRNKVYETAGYIYITRMKVTWS